MRLLITLLIAALLSVCVAACGGRSKDTSSASPTSSNTVPTAITTSATISNTTSTANPATADSDKDNDVGAPYDDKNNNSVLDYGHEAGAAEKQTVAAVVQRYYAAAAADNGVKACSMLYSTLAEAVPEDYGQGSAGPSYLRSGNSCPAVMVLMFKHFHSQLAAELPVLEVTHVRLVGRRGLAIVGFEGKMPERQIPVIRERRTWKLVALLDSELP
jgi:hypothetical protein